MKNKTKPFKFPKKEGVKWLEALRSGEYEQGTGYLNNSKKYCCLGVLGKVCGLTDEELEKKHWLRLYDIHVVHGENENPYFEKEEELINIPKEVIGRDYDNELVNELSFKNDKKIPFTEIADWIEENVEFYEK